MGVWVVWLCVVDYEMMMSREGAFVRTDSVMMMMTKKLSVDERERIYDLDET